MKRRNWHVLLSALLMFLAIVAASRAHADIRPEVGVGTSELTLVPDGEWYQLGAPGNSLQTHGRVFSIGAVDDIPIIKYAGIALHADYVNLGHARSYCDCTTVDADYDHMTRQLAPGSPMAVYSGNGLVQGARLSVVPHVTLGDWLLGYERGVFVYRPQWTDCVYGWPAQNGQLINGCSSTPTRRQIGNVFGFFLTHGRFTLSYEQYRMPVQRNEYAAPPLWTGARVMMVSYAL